MSDGETNRREDADCEEPPGGTVPVKDGFREPWNDPGLFGRIVSSGNGYHDGTGKIWTEHDIFHASDNRITEAGRTGTEKRPAPDQHRQQLHEPAVVSLSK